MWRAAGSVALALTVGSGTLGLLGNVMAGYAESAALGAMGVSLLAAGQWMNLRRRGNLRSENLRYSGALTPIAR